MKKYVKEATDENIWTSIKNNTFGRNKDIKDFIDGLELIDESACISLDAKWGDGKTFFVRQIEEVLKYVLANQRISTSFPMFLSKSLSFFSGLSSPGELISMI